MNTTPQNTFIPFPKISRLRREIIVSEKIDGTSGTVFIEDDGLVCSVFAASRTRWVTPTDDNYGFAAWVEAHAEELRTLGPGYHRGEWYGQGINRNYGLRERRFVLFNTERWCLSHEQPRVTPRKPTKDNPATETIQKKLPPCVGLVPVLYRGAFDTARIDEAVGDLIGFGSRAVVGYRNPEGIVVFHTASGTMFKQTIDNDEKPKGGPTV